MSENERSPVVDAEYVSSVFSRLEPMEIVLDEDPLDYGPSRLVSKIKKCRDYLSNIERMALDASLKLHHIKEKHRAATKSYQIAEDRLFDRDPEVRAGRSIEDRRSLARLKLPAEVGEITRLEQGIEDMEAVLNALKYKQVGLKNVQQQIREQRSLCAEEIGLGRSWRHKDLQNPNLRPGGASPVDVVDVVAETDRMLEGSEDLIKEAEAETESDPENQDEDAQEDDPGLGDIMPVPDTTSDPTEVTGSSQDIEAFLEGGDSDSKSPEEELLVNDVDIDSLLDGM